MQNTIFLAILLVISNVAFAEEVRLKSGVVKTGEITEKTDEYITIKDGEQSLTIPFAMISKTQVAALQALPHKTAPAEAIEKPAVEDDTPYPRFQDVTISGTVKKESGFDRVSLFDDGAATVPQKTELISQENGKYTIKINIPGDMFPYKEYYFSDMVSGRIPIRMAPKTVTNLAARVTSSSGIPTATKFSCKYTKGPSMRSPSLTLLLIKSRGCGKE